MGCHEIDKFMLFGVRSILFFCTRFMQTELLCHSMLVAIPLGSPLDHQDADEHVGTMKQQHLPLVVGATAKVQVS